MSRDVKYLVPESVWDAITTLIATHINSLRATEAKMGKTMRETLENLHGGNHAAILALADRADETDRRLAALERAIKEPVPFIRPESAAKAATQPAATPDPRIAELEARIAELASVCAARDLMLQHKTNALKDVCKERDSLITTANVLRVTLDEMQKLHQVFISECNSLREDMARLMAERDAAVKRAERERADVVAWLRSSDFDHIDVSNYTKHRAIEETLCDVTTQIERGAHVGASEK